MERLKLGIRIESQGSVSGVETLYDWSSSQDKDSISQLGLYTASADARKAFSSKALTS